jgi:hypothetical protein
MQHSLRTSPPTDAVPASTESTALGGTLGALARLERRLDGGRPWARDADAILDDLALWVHDDWPANPTMRAELVCRLARAIYRAGEKLTEPNRALAVLGDVVVSRLADALQGAPDLDASFGDELLQTWRAAPAEARDVLGRIISACAAAAVRERIEQILRIDVIRQTADTGGVARATATHTVAPAGFWRDNAILLCRLRVRRGDVDAALSGLERESSADPRVLEAGADALLAAGRVPEALERLRRAAVVATDPERVRERVFELALDGGDTEAALEQVRVLLEDGGDLDYWYVLVDMLAERDPALVARLRERLHERSPALYVEVLMAEGDHAGVATASTGKTFTYEILWRMGDFLATSNAAAAAAVYERAFVLHGAIAHSRAQCTELANRVEGVLPFFADMGRPTLPRRVARDVIARQKSNIPLKRELERVFGITF